MDFFLILSNKNKNAPCCYDLYFLSLFHVFVNIGDNKKVEPKQIYLFIYKLSIIFYKYIIYMHGQLCQKLL